MSTNEALAQLDLWNTAPQADERATVRGATERCETSKRATEQQLDTQIAEGEDTKDVTFAAADAPDRQQTMMRAIQQRRQAEEDAIAHKLALLEEAVR